MQSLNLKIQDLQYEKDLLIKSNDQNNKLHVDLKQKLYEEVHIFKKKNYLKLNNLIRSQF